MIQSQSERQIYDGCIELMQKLTDQFREYLDFVGIDITEIDEDELFRTRFSPMEIVRTLFLSHTDHSGGTSTREKCTELGINTDAGVYFDFDEWLKEQRADDDTPNKFIFRR